MQITLAVIPLVVCGLVIGRTVDRRYLRSIPLREADHRQVLVTQWGPALALEPAESLRRS